MSTINVNTFEKAILFAVKAHKGQRRKGNVEIVCAKYDIPLFNNVDEYKHYIDILIKNDLL